MRALFQGPQPKLHWFTIIYASGAKVHVKAEDLQFTRYADGNVELNHKGLTSHRFIGLVDISSVWEGKL